MYLHDENQKLKDTFSPDHSSCSLDACSAMEHSLLSSSTLAVSVLFPAMFLFPPPLSVQYFCPFLNVFSQEVTATSLTGSAVSCSGSVAELAEQATTS